MSNLEFVEVPIFKKGSGIHIKKKNRGKFTEYCDGKVTQECIDKAKNSGNKKLIKRAVFAENSRKWKHQKGGVLNSNKLVTKYQKGTSEGGIIRRGLKFLYGLTLPEYEGTYKEAFRQARINGDEKFKWNGGHYTTELAPNPLLEALKQWDTKGSLSKEEFKNQALRHPNDFIDFYSKSYKKHLDNRNFDVLYGITSNGFYTENTDRREKPTTGQLIYANLADGWDPDQIYAALGNSYAETGGWSKLVQLVGQHGKGLFMMESPQQKAYLHWLKANNLEDNAANQVNYVQYLFDTKDQSLQTPWSRLALALESVNKKLKYNGQKPLNNEEELQQFVKNLKSTNEAKQYGVRSAWQHQDYTTEQAWQDWEQGDLDSKTKAFEALFERAGIPHMDRRYYLAHLIKKNQHLYNNEQINQ